MAGSLQCEIPALHVHRSFLMVADQLLQGWKGIVVILQNVPMLCVWNRQMVVHPPVPGGKVESSLLLSDEVTVVWRTCIHGRFGILLWFWPMVPQHPQQIQFFYTKSDNKAAGASLTFTTPQVDTHNYYQSFFLANQLLASLLVYRHSYQLNLPEEAIALLSAIQHRLLITKTPPPNLFGQLSRIAHAQ